MTLSRRRRNCLIAFGSLVLAVVFRLAPAQADPSKYPAFVQQKLPEDIKPAMIGIEELVKELKAGAKPVIVDVRRSRGCTGCSGRCRHSHRPSGSRTPAAGSRKMRSPGAR